MIRIIVQTVDASMAAHVGGPVQSWLQSFDYDLPELEAVLRGNAPEIGGRQVIGVEVLDKEPSNG